MLENEIYSKLRITFIKMHKVDKSYTKKAIFMKLSKKLMAKTQDLCF